MAKSNAYKLAQGGIKLVDNVLSYGKSGRGQPGQREQSLFLAATAMAYAVWENYIEQVAIELVEFVAANIGPASVPETAKVQLSKNEAWSLAVHPGWRELWVKLVRTQAVGDREGNAATFGMNTAGTKQVRGLFNLIGVLAFDGLEDETVGRVDDLVSDRGVIVHTAQAPPGDFRKSRAVGWRDFVKKICTEFDDSLLRQGADLVGSTPW